MLKDERTDAVRDEMNLTREFCLSCADGGREYFLVHLVIIEIGKHTWLTH